MENISKFKSQQDHQKPPRNWIIQSIVCSITPQTKSTKNLFVLIKEYYQISNDLWEMCFEHSKDICATKIAVKERQHQSIEAKIKKRLQMNQDNIKFKDLRSCLKVVCINNWRGLSSMAQLTVYGNQFSKAQLKEGWGTNFTKRWLTK